jgi:hypothetical protein
LRAAHAAAGKPVDDAVEAANSSYHGSDLTPDLSAARAAADACGGIYSDMAMHLATLHATRALQNALSPAGGEGSVQAVEAVLLRVDYLGSGGNTILSEKKVQSQRAVLFCGLVVRA